MDILFIDLLKIFVLGVVEGVTEFFPISSTAHLILVGHFIDFTMKNTETFHISIQLGAILASFIYFRRYFTPFFSPKNWFQRPSITIFVASIPIMVVGFLGYGFIKSFLLTSYLSIVFALFVGGVMMVIVDFWYKKHPPCVLHVKDITLKQAFLIGCIQCLALWPGFSRSASTIIGGLIVKCDYQTATKFSFVIAVPVLAAAVGYDLLKSFHLLTVMDIQFILIGFFISFLVGFFSIVTFLKLVKQYRLMPFGIYRIVLSLIIAVFLFI